MPSSRVKMALKIVHGVARRRANTEVASPLVFLQPESLAVTRPGGPTVRPSGVDLDAENAMTKLRNFTE